MGKYESPDYEVLLREDGVEIRIYEEFYIVEYDDERDPDIENGFGTLFRYIGGANEESEKISMTVPVIEEMDAGRKKMAFVVPKEHWDHIPEPESAHLSVRKFEAGIVAAIQYGGLPSASKEEANIKLLADWLDAHGYRIRSPFYLAYYNSPFALPMLRRNEVLVRVEQIGD